MKDKKEQTTTDTINFNEKITLLPGMIIHGIAEEAKTECQIVVKNLNLHKKKLTLEICNSYTLKKEKTILVNQKERAIEQRSKMRKPNTKSAGYGTLKASIHYTNNKFIYTNLGILPCAIMHTQAHEEFSEKTIATLHDQDNLKRLEYPTELTPESEQDKGSPFEKTLLTYALTIAHYSKNNKKNLSRINYSLINTISMQLLQLAFDGKKLSETLAREFVETEIWISNLKKASELEELKSIVKQKAGDLENKGECLLAAGHLAHAVLYKIKRNEQGEYFLVEYNAGDEAQEIPNSDKVMGMKVQKIKNPSKEIITEIISYTLIRSFVDTDLSVISAILRKSINNNLSSVIKHTAVTPQGKGNCTSRSIREFLRDVLPEEIFNKVYQLVLSPPKLTTKKALKLTQIISKKNEEQTIKFAELKNALQNCDLITLEKLHKKFPRQLRTSILNQFSEIKNSTLHSLLTNNLLDLDCSSEDKISLLLHAARHNRDDTVLLLMMHMSFYEGNHHSLSTQETSLNNLINIHTMDHNCNLSFNFLNKVDGDGNNFLVLFLKNGHTEPTHLLKKFIEILLENRPNGAYKKEFLNLLKNTKVSTKKLKLKNFKENILNETIEMLEPKPSNTLKK